MSIRRGAGIAVLGIIAVLAAATAANAGCGCEKPPPPAADIRPAFASPGDEVTLFPTGLKEDAVYFVTFKAGSRSATILATATRRRDFADAVEKLQIVVETPDLPPGPTRVIVSRLFSPMLDVSPDQFTVLQRPLALAEVTGRTVATCYRAAVSTDGTVYLPLDISAIADRMVFSGLGMHYPLLFGDTDIAIYNTQGVLMQLLGPDEAGIYAIADPLGTPHSFELVYDRHEFNTYREQHAHAGGYGLDPGDPAWHTDGTRHIDHDHLIVAIRGLMEDGSTPKPGATLPFDLDIVTSLADAPNGKVNHSKIEWSNECTGKSGSWTASGGGDDD
jgi:hypothetical protein